MGLSTRVMNVCIQCWTLNWCRWAYCRHPHGMDILYATKSVGHWNDPHQYSKDLMMMVKMCTVQSATTISVSFSKHTQTRYPLAQPWGWHIQNKVWLTKNIDFWSWVRRFAKNFHKGCSHHAQMKIFSESLYEWPNILIYGKPYITLFLTCSLEWPALAHHETHHVNGLVQETHSSSALAIELRLSCTNPSMYSIDMPTVSKTLIIYSHNHAQL